MCENRRCRPSWPSFLEMLLILLIIRFFTVSYTSLSIPENASLTVRCDGVGRLRSLQLNKVSSCVRRTISFLRKTFSFSSDSGSLQEVSASLLDGAVWPTSDRKNWRGTACSFQCEVLGGTERLLVRTKNGEMGSCLEDAVELRNRVVYRSTGDCLQYRGQFVNLGDHTATLLRKPTQWCLASRALQAIDETLLWFLIC